MISPKDADLWAKAWKDAQARAPFQRHAYCGEGWVKVWDSMARQYLREVLVEEPFYMEAISFLVRERHLLPEDSVLDIGCGPGTYTFHFAGIARKVTGIDLSAGMLATLDEERRRRGVDNVTTALVPWDAYQPAEKFDLVFGALTPALNDPESLLKMERCSRRSCCYVTFGNSHNDLRDGLWELVTGEKYLNDSNHVTYPLNLLYSLGRRPTLKFFEFLSDTTATSDELIRTYQLYFDMVAGMDDEKRRKVRDYIMSRSKDGMYRMRINKQLAFLCWRVPEE